MILMANSFAVEYLRRHGDPEFDGQPGSTEKLARLAKLAKKTLDLPAPSLHSKVAETVIVSPTSMPLLEAISEDRALEDELSEKSKLQDSNPEDTSDGFQRAPFRESVISGNGIRELGIPELITIEDSSSQINGFSNMVHGNSNDMVSTMAHRPKSHVDIENNSQHSALQDCDSKSGLYNFEGKERGSVGVLGKGSVTESSNAASNSDSQGIPNIVELILIDEVMSPAEMPTDASLPASLTANEVEAPFEHNIRTDQISHETHSVAIDDVAVTDPQYFAASELQDPFAHDLSVAADIQEAVQGSEMASTIQHDTPPFETQARILQQTEEKIALEEVNMFASERLHSFEPMNATILDLANADAVHLPADSFADLHTVETFPDGSEPVLNLEPATEFGSTMESIFAPSEINEDKD